MKGNKTYIDDNVGSNPKLNRLIAIKWDANRDIKADTYLLRTTKPPQPKITREDLEKEWWSRMRNRAARNGHSTDRWQWLRQWTWMSTADGQFEWGLHGQVIMPGWAPQTKFVAEVSDPTAGVVDFEALFQVSNDKIRKIHITPTPSTFLKYSEITTFIRKTFQEPFDFPSDCPGSL